MRMKEVVVVRSVSVSIEQEDEEDSSAISKQAGKLYMFYMCMNMRDMCSER